MTDSATTEAQLSCRFCDSPNVEPVTKFRDVDSPLLHCRACDGVYAATIFDETQLADAYRRLYQPGEQYDPHLAEFESVRAGNLPRLGWNKRRFFSLVPHRMDGLRVLELGAGAGVFALACKQRGAIYRGFDLSSSIVERVRTGTDLDITHGTWRTATAECAPATCDYVVGWEVFEHVPDIRAALVALRDLLKPTGRLVFSVPNYLRHRYSHAGRLGQDAPPIHLNFWSPIAITNFLRICGYVIDSLDVKPFRSAELRRWPQAVKEYVLSKLGRFDGPTMVVVAKRDLCASRTVE